MTESEGKEGRLEFFKPYTSEHGDSLILAGGFLLPIPIDVKGAESAARNANKMLLDWLTSRGWAGPGRIPVEMVKAQAEIQALRREMEASTKRAEEAEKALDLLVARIEALAIEVSEKALGK